MDYQTEVEIDTNIENCFKAITQEINKWWGIVDYPVTKEDDEFSIFFGETKWRFKITQFVPFEKIQWNCINANHFHNGLSDIKEEWLNSVVQWKIERTTSGTKITMEHKGLGEDLNCYDVCINAWDFFINSSLKKYLETGDEMPHTD